MRTSIVREEVQRLLEDEAALLISVLPTAEYQDEHIEGAINIPLKRLDRESERGVTTERNRRAI